MANQSLSAGDLHLPQKERTWSRRVFLTPAENVNVITIFNQNMARTILSRS